MTRYISDPMLRDLPGDDEEMGDDLKMDCQEMMYYDREPEPDPGIVDDFADRQSLGSQRTTS
jgi:hypothetical protein